MAVASKTAPGPVELSRAALDQRQRLLEDARAQVERTAADRAAKESAAARDEQAHAAALRDSAAKRDDDALADKATRAGVRLGHARSDLAAAVKAHEEATARLSATEASAADAQREHELATLIAALNDGSHERELAEHVEAMVDAVLALRDRALQIRARLAADAATVDRLRALGGSATAPDGVCAAGHFARVILSRGGTSPTSGNIHELRWPFQTPARVGEDADGAGFVTQFASMVLKAMSSAAKPTAANGQAELARVAAVWPKHRTITTADEELKAADRAEAERKQVEFVREHPERVARMRASQEEQTRRLYNVPASAKPRASPPSPAKATPRSTPKASAAELPEGEFDPE
jgi:hypothetical protein